MSRERRRVAAAERRIKVSGNVIYEIDLNPAFKPRAIIQSRSPFPSFSISRIFSPFPSSLAYPAGCVLYRSRARSIFDIYLGTYSSYSLHTLAYITYTRIANSVDSLRSRSLSSSITDGFRYETIAPFDFISHLIISILSLFPAHR